jgi:hypothetical protein
MTTTHTGDPLVRRRFGVPGVAIVTVQRRVA